MTHKIKQILFILGVNTQTVLNGNEAHVMFSMNHIIRY